MFTHHGFTLLYSDQFSPCFLQVGQRPLPAFINLPPCFGLEHFHVLLITTSLQRCIPKNLICSKLMISIPSVLLFATFALLAGGGDGFLHF